MDKYKSSEPPPTAHEREVLEILIEECAEVQQRATKALRFGPTETQPGQDWDNRFRLGIEIGDLMEIIDRAIRAGLVPQGSIEYGRQNKRVQLTQFMQTTP